MKKSTKNNLTKHNAKGFTLIELLIFTGIFTILLVIFTEIITSALNVQLESQSVSSIEQDGRFIISRLMNDISRAKAITVPSTLGTAGTTNSLTLNIEGADYTYHSTGNIFLLDSPIGNNVPLTSYDSTVSNISFTRYGNRNTPSDENDFLDTVKINFTLTSKSIPKSGPRNKTFSTTVGLRCYNVNCL